MKKWLCTYSAGSGFTKGKIYNTHKHSTSLIDDTGSIRLSAGTYNIDGYYYYFKEIRFEDYVKQAEMCL